MCFHDLVFQNSTVKKLLEEQNKRDKGIRKKRFEVKSSVEVASVLRVFCTQNSIFTPYSFHLIVNVPLFA